MLRQTIVVSLAAAVVLSGCTGSPEPTTSKTPTQPPASSSPTAEPTPHSTPTPSQSPSAPMDWAAPADWKQIDISEAGIDADSVTSVVGAWQLSDGAIASIVVVGNDAGTTDPGDFFDATFKDFADADDLKVTHASRTTDAGEPALVVTAVPKEDQSGDAQQFILVLRPDSVAWATLSDTADGIIDSSGELWELMRTFPAS